MNNENTKAVCADFDSEIESYLDNDLPAERIDFWKNHLMSCDRCSKAVSEWNQVLARAKESLTVDIQSSEFEQLIAKAVETKQNVLSRFWTQTKIRRGEQSFQVKLAIAGGSTILVILIALLISIPLENSSLKKLSGTKLLPLNAQTENIDQQVEMIFGGKLERELDKVELQLQNIESDFHHKTQN